MGCCTKQKTFIVVGIISFLLAALCIVVIVLGVEIEIEIEKKKLKKNEHF